MAPPALLQSNFAQTLSIKKKKVSRNLAQYTFSVKNLWKNRQMGFSKWFLKIFKKTGIWLQYVNFKNLRKNRQMGSSTGIPRLTRFLWQPKNRVRRNSCYASQSMTWKNVKKICITLYIFKYKTVLCKFSWTTSKIRAMGNRAIENRVRRGMPVYSSDFSCLKILLSYYEKLHKV